MRLKKLVLAACVAAIAALGVASSALATPDNGPYLFDGPDPQEANVPWVAWVGQTVRVAKCVPYDVHGPLTPDGVLDQATADRINLEITARFNANGSFLIEDWSGLQTNWPSWTVGGDPKLATRPVQVTDRGLCWAATMTSEKPGLAKFKLSVEHELLVDIFLALESKGLRFAIGVEDIALWSDVVLEHQGLVIFLQQAGVSIYEAKDTDPGLSVHVGDPLGDGKFVPPYDCSAYEPAVAADDADADRRFRDPLHRNLWCVFGLVKINVKGKFPLGNNYSGLIAGDEVTLPDQWADLANALAADIDSRHAGDAAWRWDIHDDQAKGDGLFGWHPFAGKAPFDGKLPDHHVNSICKDKGFGGTNKNTDAVDNCLGSWANSASGIWGDQASDWGPFSSIYGGTYPTIGPFDPIRPEQTLNADGNLNAGDAPMPSLPVEVSLGSDSIGALAGVDKSDIYTVLGPHAGQGPPAAPNAGYGYPHNQYAPFYQAYVPASGAGFPFRTGPYQATTNNFPGYIEKGIYEYWRAFEKSYRSGTNGCYDVLGNEVPKPTGINKLEVYTDEHGEAWVKFYPYRGLFLTPDLNGLCDVYTTGGKPAPYGKATITAAPYYPGQTVVTPAFKWGTASLEKHAYHLADKSLVCLPKAPKVAFCVETVTDYNGDPVKGARVRFETSGDAANIIPAAIKYNDKYDTTGQQSIEDPFGDFALVWTNSRGQAGIEFVHSQNVCVDVTAENLDTRNGGFGILRHFEFNAYTGKPCGDSTGGGSTGGGSTGGGSTGGGSTGGGSTGGGSTGGGSSTGGSDANVVSLGGPVIQAAPVLTGTKTAVLNSAEAKLFSVKVLQTQLGRFLVVNVKANPNAKKAKVLFLVKNKKTGKLVKTWKVVPAATLRIQILDQQGKVIQTVTRRVAVNKAFKIENLKLPKAAASVRTSVIA